MKNNTEVDLIFNTYELTYKRILNDAYIKKIINQNCFEFKNVFVVVNNVNNRSEVEKMCENLIRTRVISDYFFVEDYLDKALMVTDLKKSDIKSLTHYIDWALVSVYIAKSKYLLKWDADVNLVKSLDWITPSILELSKNPNFLAAGPIWDKELKRRKKECLFESEDFYYNQDFSDQIFLIKKIDFMKPIYKYFHLYSIRYPLAEFGSSFEKRIDSYFRCKSKVKITYKKVMYTHLDGFGSPYPKRSLYHEVIHKVFYVIFEIYYQIGFLIKVKNIYKK